MKNNKNTDSTSQRLAKLERYINTHRGELKLTQRVDSFNTATTGTTVFVTGIPQGDARDNRAGNRINMQRLHVNINYKMTANCNVRFIVYRDLMNDGTVPLGTDVLENVSVISPLNYNNFVAQKRFIIIRDWNNSFTTGGKLFDTSINHFKLQVPLSFSGPLNTASDARKNAVFVLCVTDTASSGAIDMFTRVDFTDE